MHIDVEDIQDKHVPRLACTIPQEAPHGRGTAGSKNVGVPVATRSESTFCTLTRVTRIPEIESNTRLIASSTMRLTVSERTLMEVRLYSRVVCKQAWTHQREITVVINSIVPLQINSTLALGVVWVARFHGFPAR